MYYLIYKIINKVNGKIYIGKHSTSNKDDGYMGSGTILRRAQNKYGIENFEKEILFECSSEDEMNEKEKSIVTADFVKRSDVYNVNEGGDGSWSYVNSMYTTDKRRKDMEEYYSDEEARKKVSDALKIYNKNLKLINPELYNKRINKAWENLKRFREENPNYYNEHKRVGWHHSKETRERLSTLRSGSGNGMCGKIWVTNYDKKINLLIDENDEIPTGFVRGRCYDFDHREKMIKIQNDKKEKNIKNRLINNKFNIDFYTKAVDLYNEVGYDEMVKILGYQKSKTSFFRMAKKYSAISLAEVNKSNHIKGKKQPAYTMKTRRMSKDERIKFYTEVYETYKSGGFDAVVEKYDYPNTRNALLGCFKMYVKSYVPVKCNRWG